MVNKFVEWRHRLGLTQERAGDVLGVGARRIRQYEAGAEPSLSVEMLMTRLMEEGAQGRDLDTVPYFCLEAVAKITSANISAQDDRQQFPPEKVASETIAGKEVPGTLGPLGKRAYGLLRRFLRRREPPPPSADASLRVKMDDVGQRTR